MSENALVGAEIKEQQHDEQVQIVRGVRFGRLMLVGAVIGAVVALALTLTTPIAEDALYTMNQIAGFMLVLGAVIGFVVGALLGLLLNIFAKKKQGTGTAVHSDVHLVVTDPTQNGGVQ